MEGLEIFREAFEAYSENYVIIGGTACDIAMTGTAVLMGLYSDILCRINRETGFCLQIVSKSPFFVILLPVSLFVNELHYFFFKI